MWRDEASIIDMINTCDSLIRIASQNDFTSYSNDEDKCRLSERYFAILGEAAGRITDETKKHSPEIPWSAWVGLRNIVVHQYSKIDYAKLWDLMISAVPELLEQLKKLRDSSARNSDSYPC